MNPLKESVRDWLRQVFAWDFAEKQRISRAAMAQGMGMNPEQYARPFPGSSSVVNIMTSPEETSATPPATPLPAAMTSPVGQIVGRVLGYGIPAAGLLYAGTLLGGRGEPTAPVQPTAPAAQPATVGGLPPGYEWRIRVDFDPDKGGLKLAPDAREK